MEIKYGNFPQTQISKHKDEMRTDIIKLLYMKEECCPTLDKYFESILWRFSGYNDIFNHQPVMINIISVLEEAKTEAFKTDYSHKKYRKLILDASALVLKLKESDEE